MLQGYHVQITARADGDLTPEGILQKVADSSGSKYSVGPEAQQAPRPPPIASKPIATKPVFTPTRSIPPTSVIKPRNVLDDDDGWGPDAPPVTRTELEKVQPAYKPTRVNLHELKSTQPTADRENGGGGGAAGDVVKGGYQPVGKVDIAAIRRQAREAGELKDDRPEPVKGAYEPVGKVDIAAIRSRAQKPSEPEQPPQQAAADGPPPSVAERSAAFGASERLTSLPKPKVVNKFGGADSTFTKPPVPGGPVASSSSKQLPAANVASRTFADEGGKTPAQLWAERKAKERGAAVESTPITTPTTATINTQPTGEWKSSYSGKHWAPVQTTHTGMSLASNSSQKQPDASANSDAPPEEGQQGVSELRNQFAHLNTTNTGPSQESLLNHKVPIPGLPSGPTTRPEYGSAAQQPMPPAPQQPRSPTPPTPQAREASPIRVAMPVGHATSVTEAHEPSQTMPVQSLGQVVPNEANLSDDASQDIGRATAEATVGGSIRAIAQYDYEKAEDNEIELKEGEYVTGIEMVDRDWWLGVNTSGERGLFPSNYVEIIENDQPTAAAAAPEPEPEPEPVVEEEDHTTTIPAAGSMPPPPASKGNPTATALYDYEAAEDNEIGFPEGVKITNIVCGSISSYDFGCVLTRFVRNSPMMTGGLESIMAKQVYSRPTMCNSMNEHLSLILASSEEVWLLVPKKKKKN